MLVGHAPNLTLRAPTCLALEAPKGGDLGLAHVAHGLDVGVPGGRVQGKGPAWAFVSLGSSGGSKAPRHVQKRGRRQRWFGVLHGRGKLLVGMWHEIMCHPLTHSRTAFVHDWQWHRYPRPRCRSWPKGATRDIHKQTDNGVPPRHMGIKGCVYRCAPGQHTAAHMMKPV